MKTKIPDLIQQQRPAGQPNARTTRKDTPSFTRFFLRISDRLRLNLSPNGQRHLGNNSILYDVAHSWLAALGRGGDIVFPAFLRLLLLLLHYNYH